MSTRIGWTDETWNPVTGCTKVSQGCKNCYAERLTERFGRQKFTDVILHPDRLDKPLRWRKPRMVFVNSMSDLFHEDISAPFVRQVFESMARASHHTFQVLTKRPERMQRLLWVWQDEDTHRMPGSPARWPLPNVWLGVSCEDQKTADERIPLLLQTPAAVRFVSCEPLLGEIEIEDSVGSSWSGGQTDRPDWVIVGGESGPRHRKMPLDAMLSIVDQCKAAGVPCYVKQDSGPRSGMQGRIPDDVWAVKDFPPGPRGADVG